MPSNHPFHLVTGSPWPLAGAVGVMVMVTGAVRWFHRHTGVPMVVGGVVVGLIVYQWWRDVVRERTFQGCHTLQVTRGLRWGMLLFIVSEIFFFLSFF